MKAEHLLVGVLASTFLFPLLGSGFLVDRSHRPKQPCRGRAIRVEEARRRPSTLFSSPQDETEDDETYVEPLDENTAARRNLVLNGLAVGLIAASGLASASLFMTNVYTPPGFKRVPVTQFIAALGDPNASSGTGATQWGLWREDPGPRGVWLNDYQTELVSHDNIAPRGWKFDPNDWWLEEHGLIMESPKFPVPPGRYLVTGGRATTTGMTVFQDGSWKLDEGATLYDVTHLPCRSARYHPVGEQKGGPQRANRADFPVRPGAEMPAVPGCDKQDYAVMFLVGKAVS